MLQTTIAGNRATFHPSLVRFDVRLATSAPLLKHELGAVRNDLVRQTTKDNDLQAFHPLDLSPTPQATMWASPGSIQAKLRVNDRAWTCVGMHAVLDASRARSRFCEVATVLVTPDLHCTLFISGGTVQRRMCATPGVAVHVVGLQPALTVEAAVRAC